MHWIPASVAGENLFLDINRDGPGDAIDMGVRCDVGVMDEGQVRGFVNEFVEEVRILIEAMDGEGGRVTKPEQKEGERFKVREKLCGGKLVGTKNRGQCVGLFFFGFCRI